MLKTILNTDHGDWGALVARVFLGIVIMPHGLQKLLGMFGGYGFSGTVQYFTGEGIPAVIAVLIILGESFGSLFLILGLISRISAAGIAIIMTGAVLLVHAQNGFFMNWFGNQAGEGYEYHLLAIGLALVVIVRGGGAFSIDGEIARGR